MGIIYHGQESDVALFLELTDPATQVPITGATPDVQIRRRRDSLSGTLLDNWYWDGATFIATPTWVAMVETDVTNSPGLYTYFFEQSAVAANMVCLVYFRNATAPAGFSIEEHIFSNEIRFWNGTPAVSVVPGDTVMGRLADMELSTGPVAQANADSVWDEPLSGHSVAGSAGQTIEACCQGRTGSNQIDIFVRDTGGTPIQGAQIDLYDGGNTNFLARASTDIAGITAFALDDGTYSIRIWATGYSFTTPVTLVVTGPMSEVYIGTGGVPVLPPSAPNLCVIYGYVLDGSGDPVGGACVSAVPTTPQVICGNLVSLIAIHTGTREDGFFQMELFRGAEVRFSIESTGYDELKTVPFAASQDIASWV